LGFNRKEERQSTKEKGLCLVAPFGLVGKLYCCLPWRYRKTRGVEGESENNRGIWGEIENARVCFYLSKIGLQFFFLTNIYCKHLRCTGWDLRASPWWAILYSWYHILCILRLSRGFFKIIKLFYFKLIFFYFIFHHFNIIMSKIK
jgi:hypothetical protein